MAMDNAGGADSSVPPPTVREACADRATTLWRTSARGLTSMAEVDEVVPPALAPPTKRWPLRIAPEVIDPRVQKVDPPVEADSFDDVSVMLDVLVAVDGEAVIGPF